MTSRDSSAAAHPTYESLHSVAISFVDVGQGDSTLIVDAGSRRALLIDCPAGREADVERALLELGSPELDTAVITHWDVDHFGGVLPLIDSVGCRKLYYNHDTLIPAGSDPVVLATLRRLQSHKYANMTFDDAKQGRAESIGLFRWSLLAPSHRQLSQAVALRSRNLGSGVVTVDAHGFRILIGGDADGRVWRRLIDEGVPLHADIFRWPHHGALGNTTNMTSEEELLAAVDPKYVGSSSLTGQRCNQDRAM